MDGNLAEWKNIPGVTIFGKDESVDSIEVLRRPWLALKESHPGLVSGRLKMAWDDENLYVCAEVNDPTDQKNAFPMEGREESKHFDSKASDEREPYKKWLAKNAPGRSFAEVPYVYADDPENPRQPGLPTIPFRRDRLQLGFDVTEGWHEWLGMLTACPTGSTRCQIPITNLIFMVAKGEEASFGGIWLQVCRASMTVLASLEARIRQES